MAELFFIQKIAVYLLSTIEFSGIMVIGFEESDALQNVRHCRKIAGGMQHLCTVKHVFQKGIIMAGVSIG